MYEQLSGRRCTAATGSASKQGGARFLGQTRHSHASPGTQQQQLLLCACCSVAAAARSCACCTTASRLGLHIDRHPAHPSPAQPSPPHPSPAQTLPH